MTPSPAGALAGVRVLDLTRYIPGPYCTMLLGDLGADVVKVEEPPFGDPTRVVPPAVGEDTAAHRALNRNKRSITVDLRNEAGAAVVRRLAGRADVLIEAFRPGVLARRGLGAETLLADHPRLIYCSITGYGQDGPQAGRAGHDVNYAALGGLLASNRDAEGRPVLPGAQLADMTGALLAALGILAALAARERTGRGQLVDLSLLDGVLALLSAPAARRTAGGPAMAVNELTGSHACYNLYRCRDGQYLAVGALEPKFWESLCRALGLPELAARQWESGPAARETIRRLAETFAAKDRDDWVRELSAVDACVEPVLEPDEALTQPQVTARGSVVEDASGNGRLRLPATPLRLSGTPPSSRRPAPRLGEHTDEVLAEVGFAPSEIARLREQGAIG